ncbi:hypothetical protein DO97_18650 [Neosynechococcus sphagnicola sy1]|uniref:CopG family transcriptional regulator n=1 Tax=Neosynechococcus sphagnicola sy1 TaxID=1497020 RepID=A0A098TNS9_9CYAN|nr:hypothetical protein [Neosynechococcus sphagnicola]KGF73522.1 hypothetical protein DO97_18650 [Neosynechococcus sphagnicola sy1]
MKTKHAAHGENKSIQFKALLTPKTSILLKEKAIEIGISQSELLECFAREQLRNLQKQEVTQILGEA